MISMDFEQNNPQYAFGNISKLMIDKNEVAQVLQKLIDEYPTEIIPRSVVRDVLLKFMGSSALAALSDHPSVHKLEQALIRARSLTSS